MVRTRDFRSPFGDIHLYNGMEWVTQQVSGSGVTNHDGVAWVMHDVATLLLKTVSSVLNKCERPTKMYYVDSIDIHWHLSAS